MHSSAHHKATKRPHLPSTGGVALDSERVREEMAHRGWSQADLALIAGLSKQTVSTAVRGVSIRPSTARAIQTAFERHPRRLDGILAEIPA